MPLETVDLDGVDVLSAGGPYHGSGSPKTGDFYTEADLKKIAKSHARLGPEMKPRNLVGHDPRQQLLSASELYGDDQLPAAGWLTNFRVSKGKLLADVKRVPKKLAELIEVGAFRTRSVGLKKLTSQTTGEKHLVVDHLAWLGKKAPAVRNLDDIYALYSSAPPDADLPSGWIEESATEIQYDEAATVWAAHEGLNWLRDKLQARLNELYAPPGSEMSSYWIRDIAPGKMLIGAPGADAGAYVATFTLDAEGNCEIQPQSAWQTAEQEWVVKRESTAYAAFLTEVDRVSRLPADTTGEMPDEITISAEAVASFAERMGVDPEDVTEETLAGYVTELAEKAETPDDGDGDGDGDGEGEGESGMVKLSESDVTELRQQAAAGARAERELHEMKRDGVIDQAIEDCKIEPAARETWQKRYDDNEEMVTTILSEMKPDAELLTVYGDDGDGMDEAAREQAAKDEDSLYAEHMAESHGVVVQSGEVS